MFLAKTVSIMISSRTSVPAMPMVTGLRSRNGFMSARAHRVLVVDADRVQHLLLARGRVVVGDLAVRLAEEEVEPGAVGRGPSGGVDPLGQVLDLLRELALLVGELVRQAAQVL